MLTWHWSTRPHWLNPEHVLLGLRRNGKRSRSRLQKRKKQAWRDFVTLDETAHSQSKRTYGQGCTPPGKNSTLLINANAHLAEQG